MAGYPLQICSWIISVVVERRLQGVGTTALYGHSLA
jgi:hypothetical protein